MFAVPYYSIFESVVFLLNKLCLFSSQAGAWCANCAERVCHSELTGRMGSWFQGWWTRGEQCKCLVIQNSGRIYLGRLGTGRAVGIFSAKNNYTGESQVKTICLWADYWCQGIEPIAAQHKGPPSYKAGSDKTPYWSGWTPKHHRKPYKKLSILGLFKNNH